MVHRLTYYMALIMYDSRLFFNLLWKSLSPAGLASGDHFCLNVNKPLLAIVGNSKSSASSLARGNESCYSRLDKPLRSFSAYVKGYGSLSVKERLLVALRSAHLGKARYLLPELSLTAIDCGLRPSDVQFVVHGRHAPGWSLKEQLLIRVADDLYNKNGLEERVWEKLLKLYSHVQILDIIFCASAFHLCTF